MRKTITALGYAFVYIGIMCVVWVNLPINQVDHTLATKKEQSRNKDIYGMYEYTRNLLNQIPPGDPWKSGIPLIYQSFDKMAVQSSSFTNPTMFVQATSNLYKSALGDDYDCFSCHFFTPLKIHLDKINKSGKLPSTVKAHAEVWREISRALHEFKTVDLPERGH